MASARRAGATSARSPVLDFFDPIALHAQYPDLDERALQMLEPPNARYGDRGRVLASMQPGEVGDRFNQRHTVLSQSKL